MAGEENGNGNGEPPKFKIGGGSKKKDEEHDASSNTPKSSTSRIDLSEVEATVQGEMPPKARPITPSETDNLSADTTKINLSDVQEPPPTAKKDTGKISGETTPISLEQIESPPSAALKSDTGAIKAGTSRIDLSQVEEPPKTKAETDKISLADTIDPINAFTDDDFNKQTMQMAPITDEYLSDSAEDLGSTMKVDLVGSDDLIESNLDDSSKTQTMAIDTSAFAKPSTDTRPKTLRIKKSDKPPTIARKKPGAGMLEDDETSTAAPTPPGRRKTIKIKRPEGGTVNRPVTIARATPEESAGYEDEETESVGALPAVFALLTVLIAIGLIWMLASQDVMTNLPWPGKIIN